MVHETLSSDKRLGVGVLFSLLALGGAAGMLASGDQLTTAWAFAVAVAAALVAIVGLHAFGD